MKKPLSDQVILVTGAHSRFDDISRRGSAWTTLRIALHSPLAVLGLGAVLAGAAGKASSARLVRVASRSKIPLVQGKLRLTKWQR